MLKLNEIAKERADWLLDVVAMATQNRQFLRGEPQYDKVAGDAILQGAERAIKVAVGRAMLPLLEEVKVFVAGQTAGDGIYRSSEELLDRIAAAIKEVSP